MRQKHILKGAAPTTVDGGEQIVPPDLAAKIDMCLKKAPVDEGRESQRKFGRWISDVGKDATLNRLLSADCWGKEAKISITLHRTSTRHDASNRHIDITPNDDGTNSVKLYKQARVSVPLAPGGHGSWGWKPTTPNELLGEYGLAEIKAGFTTALTQKVADLERITSVGKPRRR
jgi:hypothetical protein